MPAISVKVNTKKLIAAMEAKAKELQQTLDDNEKLKEKDEKARQKHEAFVQREVPKLAAKVGALQSINVRDYGWQKQINVELNYTFEKADGEQFLEPKAEAKPDYALNETRSKVDELGNAIRLLKMTDEESVNTSTYKSVAKYL